MKCVFWNVCFWNVCLWNMCFKRIWMCLLLCFEMCFLIILKCVFIKKQICFFWKDTFPNFETHIRALNRCILKIHISDSKTHIWVFKHKFAFWDPKKGPSDDYHRFSVLITTRDNIIKYHRYIMLSYGFKSHLEHNYLAQICTGISNIDFIVTSASTD